MTTDPARDNAPPVVTAPLDRDVLVARLGAKVARSITSASKDGRTVERPVEAARYVVNMLTVHELELLADLAVTFAREQVGRHYVQAPLATAEEPTDG